MLGDVSQCELLGVFETPTQGVGMDDEPDEAWIVVPHATLWPATEEYQLDLLADALELRRDGQRQDLVGF